MLHQIYICSKLKRRFLTALFLFCGLFGYAQGCLFDPAAAARQQTAPLRPRLGAKSKTFSHRLANRYPPIANQGDCNSCTAWACIYYGLTIQQGQQLNPYSPYFICEKTKRCKTGMYLEETVKALNAVRVGTIPRIQGSIPNCDDGAPKNSSTDTLKKLYQFDPKQGMAAKNLAVDTLMQHLETYLKDQPVILILRYHPDLKNLQGETMLPLDVLKTMPASTALEPAKYHAVCVVGYNNREANPHIEIINSWGAGWGDQGFAKIKKEHIQSLVAAVYTFK